MSYNAPGEIMKIALTIHPFSSSFRSVIWPILTLCFLAVTLATGAPVPAAPAGPVDLTVLHLNDTHGALLPFVYRGVTPEMEMGGAAHFAALINEERAKDPEGTLLLSAGDMFQGNAMSNRFYGAPMLEVMNLLRFDAMTIGNHEFDWGQKKLDEIHSRAQFPFLCANITDAQGQTVVGSKPYIVLERKGIRIAIIGLSPPDIRKLTKPTNVLSLKTVDPAKAVKKILKELRPQKADLVLVLSHLGLEADKRLAKKVEGIDLIVGGHSHSVVRQPIRENDTLITQAGYFGVFLGRLNLRLDPRANPRLALLDGSGLIPVTAGPDRPADAEVARIVEAYHSRIRAEFAEVVGETTVNLIYSGDGETVMGNLICDAMRASMNADLAIQNGGGIRAGIEQGPITREELFTVLPFDNLVVLVDLTGKQLWDLVAQANGGRRRTIQLSGARAVFEADAQKRLTLRSLEVNGQPVKPKSIYRVATNDFLYMGGEGVKPLETKTRPRFGPTVFDATMNYLKHNSPVSPVQEGRVVIQ